MGIAVPSMRKAKDLARNWIKPGFFCLDRKSPVKLMAIINAYLNALGA